MVASYNYGPRYMSPVCAIWVTIQGCVSQYVEKFVVALQRTLNGYFNTRQLNDGCETDPRRAHRWQQGRVTDEPVRDWHL